MKIPVENMGVLVSQMEPGYINIPLDRLFELLFSEDLLNMNASGKFTGISENPSVSKL